MNKEEKANENLDYGKIDIAKDILKKVNFSLFENLL